MINNFTRLLLTALGAGLSYAAQAATEPTAQPSVAYNPVSGSAATTPSAGLKLTEGNGTRYLVVVRLSTAARVAPTDGVTYTANLLYGNNTGVNRTTGAGNFVVYADVPPTATNFNKITVTGLASGSSYVVDVYAYNQDGTGIDYLQTNPATVSFLALPTYTWNNPSASTTNPADFGTAANWTPNRTLPNPTSGNPTPNANDVLVFDGAVTSAPTVQISRDFGSNRNEQIFGQLYLVNNAAPTFYSPSTANTAGTLQIGNSTTTGDDFVIEAGSAITMTTGSNTNNRYIVVNMPTGTTARISGAYQNVLGTSINIPHRFVAADAGAIRFLSGSLFSSAEVVGHPFGTTAATENPVGNVATGKASAGSVVFETGAVFEQRSGLDPFGNGTSPVTVFQSCSTYRYFGGTFSEAARTYGNLEFYANYSSTTASFATTIQSSLSVIGSASLAPAVSLNNTGGVAIGGNITVTPGTAGGTSLTFAPASAANITLNGAQPQVVGGTGTLSFGANARLYVDNTSTTGVTLQRYVSVSAVTFNRGLLNTVTNNELGVTLTAASSSPQVQGGNATSFVNGPLYYFTSTAGGKNFNFPTGSLRFGVPVYRPIGLTLDQTSNGGAYLAMINEGTSNQRGISSGISRISGIRYASLAASDYYGTAFVNGRLTLSFGPDDQVNDPGSLLVGYSRQGGAYAPVSGTVAVSQSGTFLTGTIQTDLTQPLTALGDFVLATTSSTIAVNPLPVELTRFTAERRGADALLRWTTALENNSAYFEVQRSRDGREFQSISRVQAQGNSTRTVNYSFLDKGVAGTVYYRLRQVDLDGKATDSRIEVLGGSEQLLVSAYPNPVQHELHLQLGPNPVQWSVLNLLGQPLRQGKALGEATIDLGTLPAGSYQLEVRSGTQRVVRPLIKTN